MFAALLPLLTSLAVHAQVPRFTTGVLGRVVHVHLPDLEPRASEGHATDVVKDGRQQAEMLLAAIRRTTVNDPPTMLEITSWRQLFTLAGWLYALTRDEDATVLETLPLSDFFNHVAPGSVPAAADPYALARAAVLPFRTNWLYQPHDAATLNLLEDFLAESLKRMSPPGDYTAERLVELTPMDFDRISARFHDLAIRVSDIWNRGPVRKADVALIRQLGDYHVTESWDVLMMLLREELTRFRHNQPTDPDVFLESLKTLAKFGRLFGPFQTEFNSFRFEAARVFQAHPFRLILDHKLLWAQHVMRKRTGHLQSFGELRAQLKCTAQLTVQSGP